MKKYFQQSLIKLEKKARDLMSLSDLVPLSEEELELKSNCENSLMFFSQTFFHVLKSPQKPFHISKAWEAMIEHLVALKEKQISNLIINACPRLGKSTLINVFYPAWIWVTLPHYSFLCVSYNTTTANKDARSHLYLAKSYLYRRLWGDKFTLRKDSKSIKRFDNTAGGYRMTGSIAGDVTGHGGDIRIVDDPNPVSEMRNLNALTKTNEWFKDVFASRSEDYSNSPIIISQQRVSDSDLTGYIMQHNPELWTRLFLPLEYDSNNFCSTLIKGKKWQDWRQEEGESVDPIRLTENDITYIKKNILFDEKLYQALWQQNPLPNSSSIIRSEWFKIWDSKQKIKFEHIVQSWDTAFTDNKKNARSACTTWGVFKNLDKESELFGKFSVLLLSVHYGHWDFPALKNKVIELYDNFWETPYEKETNPIYTPDVILIEAKASGFDLLSELKTTNLPLQRFDPSKYGSKVTRLQLASLFFANGLVYFKKDKEFCNEEQVYLTPGTEELKKELLSFPAGNYADLVDSTSQALIYLRKSNFIRSLDDFIPNFEDIYRSYTPKNIINYYKYYG